MARSHALGAGLDAGPPGTSERSGARLAVGATKEVLGFRIAFLYFKAFHRLPYSFIRAFLKLLLGFYHGFCFAFDFDLILLRF